MATLVHRNHARSVLGKAEEYLASAAANLAAERYTVAAGDAIHAGICAKDAIVTELTGTTVKGKDHGLAAKELRQALGQRLDAAAAEKGLRELVSSKADVEYGVTNKVTSWKTCLKRPCQRAIIAGKQRASTPLSRTTMYGPLTTSNASDKDFGPSQLWTLVVTDGLQRHLIPHGILGVGNVPLAG